MKWALYDLRYNPPSFDIFTFIQYVVQQGLEGIWLSPGYNRQDLYDGEEGERRRVKTIVIPAIELHGLQWKLQEPSAGEIVWPAVKDKQRYAHRITHLGEVKTFAKVNIPQDSLDRANDRFKGRRPIVVILRGMKYEECRNTGYDWRRWASDHDAEVIKDFAQEPISLADRLACYELASLNMGVNCGNMAPNYYSARPYISMKWLADPKLNKHGIREGWTIPWMTKEQKFVWNDRDNYKTIESEYQKYMAGNG